MKHKLLIISPDVISENMSGSGIRYWELAQVLKPVIEITLAVPAKSVSSPYSDIPFIYYEYGSKEPEVLKTAATQADVLMITGFTLHEFPFLGKLNIPIIIDLYSPFLFENITIYGNKKFSFQVAQHTREVHVLNSLLQRGDFFLCASERQRNFWLGMLAANNRLNPHNFEQDQTYQKLISIVPYGIPATKPTATERVLKGVYKNIEADDQVILWGGGIWDWFDPLTLIRAFAEVIKIKPKAKLFFLGTQHPHEVGIPKMRMVQKAYELTQELDLLDAYVFFNSWVPYNERHNYLLEADIGVSFHGQTIETHFSFRTRILDYIWAGLPILTNEGDTMAELVKTEDLGLVVPAGDIRATRDALLNLLNLQPSAKEFYHKSFQQLTDTMTWEQTSIPLVDFCRSPRRAADNVFMTTFQPANWKQRLNRARQTLHQEGFYSMVKLGYSYIKWRLTL